MDAILIIKAIGIGCLGAGGFYIVMSFVFHYFPMPMFMKMRTMLQTWAVSKHKKKGDLGDKAWTWGNRGLVFLILAAWWAVFVAYAYLLRNVLKLYIPLEGNDFLVYYGMAVALPVLWVLYRFFRFLYPKAEKEEDLWENDNGKTLLEKIAGE